MHRIERIKPILRHLAMDEASCSIITDNHQASQKLYVGLVHRIFRMLLPNREDLVNFGKSLKSVIRMDKAVNISFKR